MAVTELTNLVNPQVMSDMIAGKVKDKIVVTPFAKIDDTLAGRPGSTITVPAFDYIGDAENVEEGQAADLSTLTATSKEYTVKKAVKAIAITDEAMLSGYGNPVGEATSQLAKSIASKVDNDALTAITTEYDESSAPNGVKLVLAPATLKTINYEGIVDVVDLFDEEVDSEKVMFINPKQKTQLRKDANFISADKYTGDVVMTGEIGKIAGCHIVSSRKVKKQGETGKEFYACPVLKLTNDAESEDEAAAVTVFLKREPLVESDRDTLKGATNIVANEHYTVALTNQSKVALGKFKA